MGGRGGVRPTHCLEPSPRNRQTKHVTVTVRDTRHPSSPADRPSGLIICQPVWSGRVARFLSSWMSIMTQVKGSGSFKRSGALCLWFKHKFIRDEINIQKVIMCSSTYIIGDELMQLEKDTMYGGRTISLRYQ